MRFQSLQSSLLCSGWGPLLLTQALKVSSLFPAPISLASLPPLYLVSPLLSLTDSCKVCPAPSLPVPSAFTPCNGGFLLSAKSFVIPPSASRLHMWGCRHLTSSDFEFYFWFLLSFVRGVTFKRRRRGTVFSLSHLEATNLTCRLIARKPPLP